MENEMQTQFVVIKAYLETVVSKYISHSRPLFSWNQFHEIFREINFKSKSSAFFLYLEHYGCSIALDKEFLYTISRLKCSQCDLQPPPAEMK